MKREDSSSKTFKSSKLQEKGPAFLDNNSQSFWNLNAQQNDNTSSPEKEEFGISKQMLYTYQCSNNHSQITSKVTTNQSSKNQTQRRKSNDNFQSFKKRVPSKTGQKNINYDSMIRTEVAEKIQELVASAARTNSKQENDKDVSILRDQIQTLINQLELKKGMNPKRSKSNSKISKSSAKNNKTIEFLQQQLLLLTNAFQEKSQKEDFIINELQGLKQKLSSKHPSRVSLTQIANSNNQIQRNISFQSLTQQPSQNTFITSNTPFKDIEQSNQKLQPYQRNIKSTQNRNRTQSRLQTFRNQKTVNSQNKRTHSISFSQDISKQGTQILAHSKRDTSIHSRHSSVNKVLNNRYSSLSTHRNEPIVSIKAQIEQKKLQLFKEKEKSDLLNLQIKDLDKVLIKVKSKVHKEAKKYIQVKEALSSTQYLNEKTQEMKTQFRDVSKDVDNHLNSLIGSFIQNIEGMQKDFQSTKAMILKRYENITNEKEEKIEQLSLQQEQLRKKHEAIMKMVNSVA